MRAVLYTQTFCPFCVRAKEVLEKHGIDFEEHAMDSDPAGLNEIKRRYGHPTVPIVLLDGKFVGGCDDLERLERAGELG